MKPAPFAMDVPRSPQTAPRRAAESNATIALSAWLSHRSTDVCAARRRSAARRHPGHLGAIGRRRPSADGRALGEGAARGGSGPGWSRSGATGADSMSRLSDTQAIVLSAACQRRDGSLLPLPGSLRGGAATKVVAALLARGFAEERVLDWTVEANAARNAVWRNLDDGRAVLLVITLAGRDALGIEAEDAAVAAAEFDEPAPTTDSHCEAPSASQSATSASTGQERRPAPRRRERRSGRPATDTRGHQAGAPHRPARPSRRRYHRRDRRRHRLAAAHRSRRLRRGAEEAARADGHIGEARGARPGLPDRPLRSTCDCASWQVGGRPPSALRALRNGVAVR